ncbi:extracellular solute-binding protein [Streptomyces sp. CA-106110]|uniref:extracellular solute-binding protein n=1 Tax=Streptomyces sp. CA-106110 TaxID=3240044 RepID=UPI003D8DC273
MRSRLLTGAAIAVATALAVTGCSTSSGSSSKTIKVVYKQNPNNGNKVQANYLAPMVKAFEKANPGTHVQLVPVTASDSDYFTKIDLLMKSPATAPDLVYEDTAVINSDIAAGLLKPMDPYVSTWSDWAQFEDVSKGSVKGFSDGKTYGVPDGTDTRGIWYNKQIFAKAGISVPWQPKTWDDVLAAAKQVKAKVPGVAPLNLYSSVASGEASSMQGMEMLLYGTPAAHNSQYDWTKKKWMTGSQGFKDALDFVHSVYGGGLGPSLQQALGANFSDTVGTQLLPQGKLAMDIDGSWMPNNWLPSGGAPWKDWSSVMGVAPMPTQHGQGSGKISMSGGFAWSIPAKAKNPDLAFKFLKSIQTESAAAKWDVVNAQIPVRKDVAADPTFIKGLPSNKFFTDLVPDTFYRPSLPAYNQVSTATQKAMEAVASGQSSAEKAASAYDNEVAAAVGSGSTVKGS